MLQCPARIWNEVAETQEVETPLWARMMALDQQEMAEADDAEWKRLKAEGTSSKVAQSFLLVAPLLMENKAISRFIEQVGRPDLRSSLPELTSISEAVALATGEHQLNPLQQSQLKSLLQKAYQNQSDELPSSVPQE